MKSVVSFLLHLRWLHLPGALLLALLQRTPLLRVAVVAEAGWCAAPPGSVLRTSLTAVASLGALHALAGATQFVASRNPVTGTAGTAIAGATVTVTGAQVPPGSFRIMLGAVPPGLSIAQLNPSTSIINASVVAITGTPTVAGNSSLVLRAYQFANAQGDSFPATLGYTVNFSIGAPVDTPPVFSAQPAAQTIAAGSTVVFSASATGAISYQWRKDGADISGATRAMLVLPNATTADAASYAVVASNASGGTASAGATLAVSNVAPADVGRLINLSILTPLGAGETMTMGTVLGGGGTSGSKALLARAAGPSLAQFGVTGVLPDPQMTLASRTGTVDTNNDWAGAPALSNAFAQVGAFAYTSAMSKDAALYEPALAAGDYTVQVNDATGADGTVIAELYDSTPRSAFNATTPRLVNVSVLKNISAGVTLTAGFVIGGTTARSVLVRAIGPGLAQFGVGGVMPDPQLTLFSQASGAKIAENDNWGGDAQLTTAGNNVGAFAIGDAASRDAMLFVTLAPGNYSATVAGVGAGGTVLVEVYEVP